MTSELVFALCCHAQSVNVAVRQLRAAVRVSRGGVALRFALSADLALLRIPQPAPPHAADELWRHTCFEVFTAARNASAYHEFNFSPSGQWAAYAFRSYRERAAPLQEFQPSIVALQTDDLLTLEASIPRTMLPPSDTLQLGLCAVIEDRRGAISYWALRHAPGKPDFHHRDAFAAALDMAAADHNDLLAWDRSKQ